MTTKTVYVMFAERNIEIMLPPPQDSDGSDWDMLRILLKQEAQTDLDLAFRLDGCNMYFQRIKTKTDGSKTFVEVREKTSGIAHDDELRLTFQREMDPSMLSTSISPLSLTNLVGQNLSQVMQDISDIEDNRQIFTALTPAENELQAEDAAGSLAGSFPQSSEVVELANTGTASAQLTTPVQQSSCSVKKTVSRKRTKNPPIIPSVSRGLRQIKRSCENMIELHYSFLSKIVMIFFSFQHFKKPKPGEFIELPAIPEDSSLAAGCAAGLTLLLQPQLIKMYGNFLREQTKDHPSKSDYDLVGEAVCHRHPELKDDSEDRKREHVSKIDH